MKTVRSKDYQNAIDRMAKAASEDSEFSVYQPDIGSGPDGVLDYYKLIAATMLYALLLGEKK